MIQKLFPYLVPDYKDAVEDILPSFAAIRQKTTDTIYSDDSGPHRPDKSPKGSVDEPIRDLVDLINAHPSFSTVSSCSGRIALFDPTFKHELPSFSPPDAESALDDEVEDRPASGKGGSGGWLLAAHEIIEPSVLIDIFQTRQATDNDENRMSTEQQTAMLLSFKFEPMLLHVAAATQARGQQLLQLALQLGFRESGLVVTSSRVTVAIRGYGLALSVPLARQGPLRPLDNFLYALAVEANRRLEVNLTKIQKLYDAIQHSMFQQAELQCQVRARPLPDLNLWGQAAVAIPSGTDVDILVFGGYGQGPQLESARAPPAGCKRSDKVFRLQRENGSWKDCWEEVQISSSDMELSYTECLGVETQAVEFSARESAAACLLPSSGVDVEHVVAIHGGRKGPAHPLGDFLLYAYSEQSSYVQEPLDVRGEHPSPRWGHTMTALSSKEGQVALLYGGRNESDSLSSIHILSLVSGKAGESHFCWESVVLNSPAPPRFHHSTVAFNDTIVVLGGLTDPTGTLEAFKDETCAAFGFSLTSKTRQDCVSGENGCPRFGHNASVLPPIGQRILVTGGLDLSSQEDVAFPSTIQCMTASRNADQWTLKYQKVQLEMEGLELGPLVHHSSLCLPSDSSDRFDVVMVGGGVFGFAFKQCFAQSCLLRVRLSPYSVEDDIVDNARVDTSTSSSQTEKAALTREVEPPPTNVLYVSKLNAKSLKTALEESSLLNKTYRMAPADSSAPISDPENFIAVPVTTTTLDLIRACEEGQPRDWHAWMLLVEGTGQQKLPYSTAVFCRKSKKM